MLHVSVIIIAICGVIVDSAAVLSIDKHLVSFRELRSLVDELEDAEASNEQIQRRLSCEISVLEGLYDESNGEARFVLSNLPIGCTIEEAQSFLNQIGAHSGSTDFATLISESLVDRRSALFELQAQSVELSWNMSTQREKLQRLVGPLCQELDHAKKEIEESLSELSQTIQELLEEVRVALDRESRLMSWIERSFQIIPFGRDSHEELVEFVEDYMDGTIFSLTDRLSMDPKINRHILRQISQITASAIARVRRDLVNAEMELSIKDTELEFIQSYLNEVSEVILQLA
jgi:hypothetical protein